MSSLPPIFAASALVAAALCSLAVWAPRRLPVRAGALAVAALFMPLGYAGYSDLLSRPKPVSLEWWLASADEATVLGSRMREGDTLYLWLQLDREPEPRAYRMPWDRRVAEELQAALGEAERNGTAVRMRLPFEPSLDRRERMFYALPQPVPPPKDLTDPPPEVYRHPGENA